MPTPRMRPEAMKIFQDGRQSSRIARRRMKSARTAQASWKSSPCAATPPFARVKRMKARPAGMPIMLFGSSNRSAATRRMRSEERRVGKEGRSLCDWSSDVCSSDLSHAAIRESKENEGETSRNADHALRIVEQERCDSADEVGRASCRERG